MHVSTRVFLHVYHINSILPFTKYILYIGMPLLICYTLTLELIREFQVIIGKRHTSKLTLWNLTKYCMKFCSGVSVLRHDRNHPLAQVHVYRTYTVILGLQSYTH